MGNNDYAYYGDAYAQEESSSNFIQQQMTRDYKGEEGKLLVISLTFF